jgi:hypothetical protein
MNKWLERLKNKIPDAEIPQMFSYQTAKTAKRHLKDESDLLDLGAYQDYEAKQGQDRKAISFPQAESSTIGPTPESSALDPVQVAPPRPYLDKERDLVIHEELFSIAVPERLKPNLFGQSDNPFLQIFREAYDQIEKIYEKELIPFIKREHPARLERLEGIKKELNRFYNIQAAHPRRRVKSEFRRFEEQAELWRQWFFHPLYLFFNHESTAEQKEEKMEGENLEQEEVEDDVDWIDRMYEKYLDDLQCFHDSSTTETVNVESSVPKNQLEN